MTNPEIARLGYSPLHGWWLYHQSCHDKIEISICPESRLIGPFIFLIYKELNKIKKKWCWIHSSRVLTGNYRTLVRIFRLSSNKRGIEKDLSKDTVQAGYQGPADWSS